MKTFFLLWFYSANTHLTERMIICYGNNICLFQGQEKEYQDKINEDAKELDKMTNKQSLLLKKVCLIGINKVCLTGIKKQPMLPPCGH